MMYGEGEELEPVLESHKLPGPFPRAASCTGGAVSNILWLNPGTCPKACIGNVPASKCSPFGFPSAAADLAIMLSYPPPWVYCKSAHIQSAE
jgi:hypothetical protein